MEITIRGQKIIVRGLLRGEIKALRAAGIEVGEVEKLPEAERDAALDRVFQMACTDLDPDAITPGEALGLYVKIIGLTWVGEEEEKKSGLEPALPSGKKQKTAGNAKKQGSKGSGIARK